MEAASSQLRIESLQATYRLPADHPAPDAARLRLDRLLETRLPAALGEALEGVLDDDDPTLWLIRSLDTELTCDLAAVEDARLARALAAAVGTSLLRTLAAGPHGQDVLRYADRPAYLAAFLVDLAAGRAWGRWQYARFETLRSLPTERALAEALLREPGTLAPALGRLAESGGLEPVLAALGERQAERLLAALRAAAPATDPDPALAVGLAEDAHGRATAPARTQLRHLAEWAAAHPTQAAEAGTVASLAAALALAAPKVPGTLLSPVPKVPGTMPKAPAGAAPKVPGTLSEAPTEAAPKAPGTLQDTPATAFSSTAAGLYLLLPSYLTLEVEALLDELGEVLSTRERPLLRRELFALTLGWPEAAHDPAVRLAAGLSPHPRTPAERGDRPHREEALATALAARLPDWWATRQARSPILAATDFDELAPHAAPLPTLAAGLLRHLGARLPGFARASADHLRRNFLVGGGLAREGRLRLGPGTLEVTLPPLPLAVVARMAGADGQTYALPWAGLLVTLRCPGA